MSVIETHLSDLRAGFGGYGFSSRLGLGSGPMLPLWRPTPAPAVSYCTSPTCPCSLPRPYIMSDLYDYPGFSYSWAAWYYKSGNLLTEFFSYNKIYQWSFGPWSLLGTICPSFNNLGSWLGILSQVFIASFYTLECCKMFQLSVYLLEFQQLYLEWNKYSGGYLLTFSEAQTHTQTF